MSDPTRPKCFDFAMEVLGDPEAHDIRRYCERIEAENAQLKADADRFEFMLRTNAVLTWYESPFAGGVNGWKIIFNAPKGKLVFIRSDKREAIDAAMKIDK
jgi:hypothetical protein